MSTTGTAAETIIGAVVVAAALGFLAYAGSVSGPRIGGDTYPLVASFRNAEGVRIGTDVRLAGIKIGTVTNLALDAETYAARVEMAVDRSVRLPEDSDIKIAQEGLLGGTFLEITPGASDLMLEGGDEILNTQSSVSLLDLLLRYGFQN